MAYRALGRRPGRRGPGRRGVPVRLGSLTAPTDTKTLIETGIRRFLEEVPGLAPLKVIAGLELHGRGDVQLYRIEMPGPTVAKALPTDAKLTLEIRRERFNELATKGHLADWRHAFERGEARATGVDQYLKLIVKVVEAQEERSRTRRARAH
ncbi:MAG: hypothetical protein KGL16_00805 [Acidobacteriota bacterium]|nr:hypothetical protein [Acidobacteriota bacterium]